MEIASVETVSDAAVDKDEPSSKKSKLEDEKSEENKDKVLKENIQPEKLKVIELRNELKDRGLDTRGVKTELVERLKAALEGESGEKETELEVDEEAFLEGESGEKETELEV